MDRQDTSISEEVRRKRLAAMANAQNPTSSEAALGGPSNATSGAGSQLNSANSEMVVATASSSSTSANGTVVNNSYMLIDTEQLKNVVSSVLPGIVEAVVSKVKLPPPAASTSAQGASGSDVVDISELVTSGEDVSGEEASNSNNNRGSGTRERSQPFSGSASTPMPGPSRTRHPARLALPCGVEARLGEASSGSQKRSRASADFSSESDTPSSAGALRKRKSKLAVAPDLIKQMKSLMNLMGSKSKKSNNIQSDSSESEATSDDDGPKNDLAARNLCFMCRKRQCSQILSCKHVYCEPCIKKQKASKKGCIRCGLKFRSWEPLFIG